MKKCNNHKGTTLTELMVAAGILAFVVLPIFGLLQYSNRGTREQDAEGIAANLAKEEMNRLLYVINRDNLLQAANNPQTWSFGDGHEVKGNKFFGQYQVYPHNNNDLNFKVPAFKFHDPMDCPDGIENRSGEVVAPPEQMNIAALYPESPNLVRMADIKLEIKWHIAGGTLKDANSFILLARRTFVDKD